MMARLLKWLRFRVSTIGPALDRYYILPRVKLHRIHSSDAEFHTHPWNGISIIFGRYTEIRSDEGVPTTRWFFNRVFAFIGHKVLVDRPVWTLFIHGKRRNENWYYGDSEKPWEGSDDERESSTL